MIKKLKQNRNTNVNNKQTIPLSIFPCGTTGWQTTPTTKKIGHAWLTKKKKIEDNKNDTANKMTGYRRQLT